LLLYWLGVRNPCFEQALGNWETPHYCLKNLAAAVVISSNSQILKTFALHLWLGSHTIFESTHMANVTCCGGFPKIQEPADFV